MYSLQAPLWIKLRVTLFKVKVFTFERVPPDVNCYVSVIRSDLMDSGNKKTNTSVRSIPVQRMLSQTYSRVEL